MSQKHEIHLMHRKLLALGSLAQYSLRRLLCCLSLKSVNRSHYGTGTKDDKAAKAISEVLSKNAKKLRKFFFTNPSIINVIYQNFDNEVFNEKIPAASLDTSPLADLLLKIGTYPVSYPINRTSVACSGHASSAIENCCSSCTGQKHLCIKCKKEKCKSQCCENNSYCSHPCVTCGTDAHDCLNMKYVCCDSCCLCMKCTLVNLNLTSWHELVGKIVGGERIAVCDMLLLRLSISLIKSFRNFMSHLTEEECRAIDNGTFNDSKFPQFCKSWVDIQGLFQFAIQQILDYLKSEDEGFEYAEMNQHMEFMRKVTTATKHTDIDIYTNAITNYLESEQFPLKDIAYKIDNLTYHLTSPAQKSLKFLVEFDFKKIIKFKLEDFEKYDAIFKEATGDYFDTEIGTDSVTARLVGKEPHNNTSTVINFIIESNSEGVDLIDYKDYYDKNNKAKNLWKSLKEKLMKEFPEIEFSLFQWDKGSIIIKVTIWKSSNEEWKEDEINEIEEKMSDFVKNVELTGNISQCVMSFKNEMKTFKDRSPTSQCLVYRLDAFSEDVVQKLDNFEEKKFMGSLQLILSNLEEGVTVTGKYFFNRSLFCILNYFLLYNIR